MSTAQTATGYRIEVTYKGETGYLRSEIGTDFKIRRHIEFTETAADLHSTRERAERALRKLEAAEQHLADTLNTRSFTSARIVEATA